MHLDDGRGAAAVEVKDARLVAVIRRPRRAEGGECNNEEEP